MSIKATHFAEDIDLDCDIAGAFQFTGYYGREGTSGMSFVCPCGCGNKCYIKFEDSEGAAAAPRWNWDGNKENPTLTPSVFNTGLPCKWHGWLQNGEWVSV
ncbi:MAG: hypothetical protein GXP05_11690 [Alphaproteobacteria bacterium]|nr:hypothetical protein [Alphaproteobacteria bacterium]